MRENMRKMMRGKIHRATITGADLHYEGSVTIDSDLLRGAGIIENEAVCIWDVNNGERFETYAIYGEPQRGLIELNGATAHLGKIGDRITIMSFARYTPEEAAVHQPRILVLDEKNKIVRYEEGDSTPSLKVAGE